MSMGSEAAAFGWEWPGPGEEGPRAVGGMAAGMVAAGLAAAGVLLWGVSAPYGRHGRRGWGPELPARLAWVIQELPSLAVPLALLGSARSDCLADPGSTALLGLFVAHYFQRTLIFPLLIRGGKPTPASVCLLALLFCLYNGFMQGYQLLLLCPAVPLDACFYAGIATWGIGLGINLHSDHVLRNLRAPGETGYKIPRGGCFEWVSGANFFGEILEWAGFALAARSPPAVAFALFTLCNIGPRALQHHRWYLERFPDYPPGRRALVPGII